MSDPYERTEEGLTAALDALGNDVHEVATKLYELGHLGNPHDCRACPAALYVAALYPDCDVYIDREHVRLMWTDVEVDERGYEIPESLMVRVETTWPVAEFIGAFDKSMFPHLVRRKS